ncbi:MAG: hypothetical protein ACT4PZ_01125 [Panacagrimonas sp.]
MNTESLIRNALAPFSSVVRSDVGFTVATQCLYPDGDAVAVTVVGDTGHYRITDHGAGYAALQAAGIDDPKTYSRRAVRLAEERGLSFHLGQFQLDDVDVSQLGAGILIVANASQVWVQDVLNDVTRRIERDLRERVFDYAKTIFSADRIERDMPLSGESTKSYQVSQVVRLGSDRLLLIEPLTNHTNAIAAQYLKFNDIGRAHSDWAREFVVERRNEWKAEDLNILGEVSEGILDIETGLEPLRARYA